MATHIDDNLGNNDAHLLPYDGIIDWNKKRKQLSSCREYNYISLEASFNYDESKIYSKYSAEEFLKLALKRARKLDQEI